MSRWRLGMAGAGISSIAAALAVGQLPGLSPVGTRSLGVFAFALCWWVGHVVEDAVTAVIVLITIALLRVVNTGAVLGVLGSTSVWTVIAVLVISRAVTSTGVGRRLAGLLLRHRASRPAVRLLELMLAVQSLVFVIPSAAGRTAVSMPVAQELAGSLDKDPGQGYTKASAIAMSYVPVMSNVALITGAPSVIYAVGLIKSTLGYDFTYTSWLVVFLPVTVALSLSLWALLLVVFRISLRTTDEQGAVRDPQVAPPERITAIEWKLGAVLALLITGWFFGTQLSIPIVLTSLVGMVLLVLPGVGVMRWDQALEASDLSLILLYAGGLGLATALVDSGAAAWMAKLVVGGIGTAHTTPLLVVLALIALALVLNLGISTNVATMAIVLPIALAIGPAAHVSPLWVGMVAVLANWVGLFMPYQSVTLLMTYATGQYTRHDLARVAVPFVAVSTLIMTMATLLFWPRLGYHP